ncbi:hypothetical protein D9758_007449 [Tetrapyrgos nigripes]|uniref:Uncharacterized protein n=1 Tax=Tetrapyrgos nigripes TaxID=182062 RepID=A0A8H5LHG6_9AGAR|nr:hypothetical protein D9758_007449 [Tetrapyrgos nigripes]
MAFRTFELNVSAAGEMGPPAELADKFAEVLPFMHSLHTFRLVNSLYYGPWPALLQAIFSAPSLTTLEICDSPWRRSSETFTEKALNLPTATLNLRKFVYRSPFTDCFPRTSPSHGRRDEIQGRVEIYNLLALLGQFNTCLEILELPAEIAPFLIEAELPYPNLRKLRVEGHIPLLLPRWRGIFSSAPQLRGVEFKVARTQVESRYRARLGGEQGFCLLPKIDSESRSSMSMITGPSSLPTPKSSNLAFHADKDKGGAGDRSEVEDQNRESEKGREDLEQATIARLRSLHLSSPCVQDNVFRHLSDSLTELSLVVYPLPGILGARWSDAPASEVRTARQMLDVLELLCLPNVMRFRMVYCVAGGGEDGQGEVGMGADGRLVARISQSFPGLEELELHRYRDTGHGPGIDQATTDPVPMIKEGLASLVNLTHIRLNLDYPQRPRYAGSRQNNCRAYRAFHDTLENGDARSIAEALNSLVSIGILFHDDFSTHWDTWSIERGQGGDVRLFGSPKVAVEV